MIKEEGIESRRRASVLFSDDHCSFGLLLLHNTIMTGTTKSDPESLFQKVSDQLRSIASTDFKINESKGKYELATKKKVTLHGKEMNGVFFASAAIQKNFIGFYYFPIYTHPEHLADVPEELKKCLKGKSCFHIKKDDAALLFQIGELLKKGVEFYRQKGLI